MKPFSFLLLFLSFCVVASAQTRLTGTVVDGRGRSVEYVNVGIEGTRTGVTSDGQGRFSLTIPDSLTDRTLYVSHITYEPKRVPIRELSNEEPLVIELSERAFAIPEVVVRPGRPRYRRVGGRGVRFPLPPGTMHMGFGYNTEGNPNYMAEIGTVLKIREPLLVEEVSFPVESSIDSLLLRVNLYQIESDSVFTPLHRNPFYVLILPGKTDWTYTVDVSESKVVARPGKILVTFQEVDAYQKKTSFAMPFYFGRSYSRRAVDSPFEKIDEVPLAVGFQLYGRVLPE
jgi:hypothetical protein